MIFQTKAIQSHIPSKVNGSSIIKLGLHTKAYLGVKVAQKCNLTCLDLHECPDTSLCHPKRFDQNRVLHYTIATKEWRIQIKWHIPRQLSYDKKFKRVALSAWFKLEHIQWFEEQPKNPWEPIIKLRFREHGGHNISTSRNLGILNFATFDGWKEVAY